MKQLIFTSACVFLGIFGAKAQVKPNAIGFRAGSGTYGSGAEISYQKGFGEMNRLELDFGWRSNRYKNNHYNQVFLAAIYHWDWNITDGLNWFVGPGAAIGLFNDYHNSNNDGLTIGVGGQIGIEYDFNVHGAPLLMGLDVRPMWGFVGYGHGSPGYGGALSLRYTF